MKKIFFVVFFLIMLFVVCGQLQILFQFFVVSVFSVVVFWIYVFDIDLVQVVIIKNGDMYVCNQFVVNLCGYSVDVLVD